MANLSTGEGDKNVSKTSSFSSFFGRSPARTESKNKPSRNLFKRLFRSNGSRKSAEDFPYTPEDADDGSRKSLPDNLGNDTANEPQDKFPYISFGGSIQYDEQVLEKTNANSVVANKVSIPATIDEKKPELEAKESLAQKGKAPDEQPVDNKKLEPTWSDNIEDAKLPTSRKAQVLPPGEAGGDAVRATQPETGEGSCQPEGKEEEKKEDNCMISLAKGLQNIC